MSADKSEKESNEGQVKNILQAHNMNEDIILLEEYSGSQWNALLELMTCVNIQEISL